MTQQEKINYCADRLTAARWNENAEDVAHWQRALSDAQAGRLAEPTPDPAAEISRLTAINADLRAELAETIAVHETARAEWARQNAALRAALDDALTGLGSACQSFWESNMERQARNCRWYYDKTRAALRTTEPETK